MDRPLKEHIAFLELRVRELNSKLMDGAQGMAARNRLAAEIRAAELALTYYRKALEIEQQLR